MADRCLCHAYFEGVYDKQIKQGQDFDLAQGVRAIDGYGNEVDFTYEPTEIDLCKTGDQEVTYKAFGASFNVVPKLCMPKYKKGVSIPEACPSDLEMITAKRIIRIIRASNPRFLGIPRVTIAQNTAFDPTEGVTAVDDNGNPITDIDYSGYLDKEASGDIASITDGQAVVPAKSLKVTLEPIQDLNGYDKPWAGGAGKNLLNVSEDNLASPSYYPGTWTGTTVASGENAITVTRGNGQGGFGGVVIPNGLKAGTYTFSCEVPSTESAKYFYYGYSENGVYSGQTAVGAVSGTNTHPSFTVTLQNDTDSFFVKMTGANTDMPLTFSMLQVENGSTATEYEPYSNICPIDGHTEVVTQRTGKNLLNLADGTVTTTTPILSTVTVPSGTYTVSAFLKRNDGANGRIYVKVGDEDSIGGSTAGGASGGISTYTFVVDEPTPVLVGVQFLGSYGTMHYSQFQLELGSTATSYEPYQGDTYTTALGQTVYGGTVNLVNGELIVDRAMVDLGDATWTMAGTGSNHYFSSGDSIEGAKQGGTYICSQYEAISPTVTANMQDGQISRTVNPESKFFIKDSRYTDATSFKTAMNGVQLVYELATPTTIQLSPQQVELLKGTNNVWSEEGDVRVIYEGNIPQDGSFEYPLEGEYTITYKATDKCGNEGTAERTIVVTPSE